MNYQKFLEIIDMRTWASNKQFEAIASDVLGTMSIKGMQLLNLAVSCLEHGEVYCEVGCLQGRSLIAALLDNPQVAAYAVDDFAESDPFGENLDKLVENLTRFELEDRVLLCQQDVMSFFSDLSSLDTEERIGVYFYDGKPDYRSQLMGLLFATSFLAEQALIIVPGEPWKCAKQANQDFLITHPQCKLVLTLQNGQRKYYVFAWGINIVGEAEESEYKVISDEPNIEFIEKLQELYIQERKKLVNGLQESALESYTFGDFDRAEQGFKQILYLHDCYSEAWHYLGLTYYMQERYTLAVETVSHALSLENFAGSEMYYSLGIIWEKSGKLALAANAYRKAIELDPKHIDARNNLGNILFAMGETEQAEIVYRQAIESDPMHPGAYLNLGNILMEKQQLDEAISLYERASELNPRNLEDICHNLRIAYQVKKNPAKAAFYFACNLHLKGEYNQAIPHYQESLAAGLTDPRVYLQLAICYKSLSMFEEAIATLQEGTRINLYADELYVHLLIVLQGAGKTLKAMETAKNVLNLLPDSWRLKFENQRILPIIYRDESEIELYRERFTRELNLLVESLPIGEKSKEALKGIEDRTTFYLNYQGKNDLPLQKKYGEFISEILKMNYPERSISRTMPPLSPSGKIRIGYISDHLRNHTVAKLFLGWLRHYDRNQFEIYCYYTNAQWQACTHRFSTYSDVFHQIPNSLDRVCEQVMADRLHILVFLDIGMSPITTLVGGLRLAPVQCVAWGHPVTTGLPTIDYFLSSDLMEPENGEEHYTETLIRLPKISVSYSKPEIPSPAKLRTDFGLRENAILYLCCQSIFKYLPQFDYIFPAIACQVSQAQFAFLAHSSNYVRELFEERLKVAFAKYEMNWIDYCVILPWQDQVDYWNLNCVCDVFLDTFTWSGGNTTLEAIACGLPIVTCPGEFMRSRHSYAILKMLEVTETIACTEAEYIDIAVRLGLDVEWRQQIIEKIKQSQHRLYDDRDCIQGLEDFYYRIVREAL